ncbi:MAG: hypothetical protein LBV30_09130 [Propionibacteriaceae bacterium]|jgi:hypothetical protein|nr:hypothetical protein [Propionibacteriaceae bacterium]
MNRFSRSLRAIGRFFNRLGVLLMRSINLVSFLVTMLLIIAVIGAYFADKYLAQGYYTDYLIQKAMNRGAHWLPRLARHIYLYPLVALVIAGAVFLGFLAIKLFNRRIFVRKGSRRSFIGSVGNVIVNVVLNLILLLSLTTVLATVSLLSQRQTGPEVFDASSGDYQSAAMALTEIMIDFDQDPNYLTDQAPEQRQQLRLEINQLIDLQLGPQSPWEHYLRNRLNEAPPTLNAMMATFSDPEATQWVLMAPTQAGYHMFGPDGEFNLKFVSTDGLLEAVYNHSGQLLTQANDPINMGTYNFADPLTSLNKHSTYDMLPYFQWGNTPGTWSVADELIGPMTAINRYSANPAAVAHYQAYKAMIAAAKGQ